MLFTSSSAGDIEKYFHGTFVKFKEFGDKLFKITSVSSNSVMGIDQDDMGFELCLSDYHPYEVDYVLPHRAVFQYKDRAMLMQRVPARQYKRGLCDQNVRIVDIGTGENAAVGFPILKSYVTKQKYFTLTEAIKHKGKLKSYALNSRMSYISGSKTLKIDTTKIGFYDPGSGVLFVNKLFVSDVLSMMKDNNETVEISSYE